MKKYVKYCTECFNNPNPCIEHIQKITGFSAEDVIQYNTIGYYCCDSKEEEYCKFHDNCKLINSALTMDEYDIIQNISTDVSFVTSMDELKQENIIEYQLKMSQFNAQKQKIEEKSTLHCPTCGSIKVSKISSTSKVFGALAFGLFSKTAKSQFECENCGYKW